MPDPSLLPRRAQDRLFGSHGVKLTAGEHFFHLRKRARKAALNGPIHQGDVLLVSGIPAWSSLAAATHLRHPMLSRARAQIALLK